MWSFFLWGSNCQSWSSNRNLLILNDPRKINPGWKNWIGKWCLFDYPCMLILMSHRWWWWIQLRSRPIQLISIVGFTSRQLPRKRGLLLLQVLIHPFCIFDWEQKILFISHFPKPLVALWEWMRWSNYILNDKQTGWLACCAYLGVHRIFI